MIEKIISIKESPDKKYRLQIFCRKDGTFGFIEEKQIFDYQGAPCWTPASPAVSGIYDSEILAECEERTKIAWLK